MTTDYTEPTDAIIGRTAENEYDSSDFGLGAVQAEIISYNRNPDSYYYDEYTVDSLVDDKEWLSYNYGGVENVKCNVLFESYDGETQRIKHVSISRGYHAGMKPREMDITWTSSALEIPGYHINYTRSSGIYRADMMDRNRLWDISSEDHFTWDDLLTMLMRDGVPILFDSRVHR